MTTTSERKRTTVVVLGDFGRSPRMQYHALSLARDAGHAVDVIAYDAGTPPAREIIEHPMITMRCVTRGEWRVTEGWPNAARLVARVLAQCIHLVFLLATMPRADAVLVQNPPCLPTFTACGVVCAVRGMELVVDWHNLAYTLFALKYGADGLMTRFCEKYERWQGRRWGTKHLCVTRAMREFLEREWGLERVTVVYDRAPDCFRRAAERAEREERWEFWNAPRVAQALRASSVARSGDVLDRYLDGTHPDMAHNKPRFVVSSTSWTPDENFGVLLDAAVEYDGIKRSKKEKGLKHYPDLVIVVTGKGPQRAMYEEKMNLLALEHVAFRTVWLDVADYPHALANAHLGVCLHTSSSGLDLPMKVVDMFGASLPVAAARYDVITELIDEGKNGALFGDAHELTEIFKSLFSLNKQTLKALRYGAAEKGRARWEDNWIECVRPMFNS